MKRVPKAVSKPYKMEIDLKVLDHLGIRLYSNAAAVLSEAVANAWDADAQRVKVSLANEEILIEDDGIGMDLDAVNDRFLKVGYDKRGTEGKTSGRGRRFMGRKGIGKLSLFSIAEEVAVHTAKSGQKHAFQMTVTAIEEAIKNRATYYPEPIPFAGPKRGTRIVLTGLKKARVGQAANALRKRIARRFSVIGLDGGASGDRFSVSINDEPIGLDDRDDLKQIEFLWEFEEEEVEAKACPLLIKRQVLPGQVDPARPEWTVRGWIGAAARPTDLRSDDAGSMNGIVVIARGRLIQENVLDKLDFNRILNSYVTGQVRADFLDADDLKDIATSDRQRLIEDDERSMALVRFLRQALVSVSDDWTEWRNEARGKTVIQEHQSLARWINGLPLGQQKPARKMLGTIGSVELEDESERRSLYKAGVLAFERLRLREASHELSMLTELTAAKLLPLLADLTSLEGTMYIDIVRERLTVIDRFAKLVDENEKEKVLQQCVFEQMWLLDAGWERATGNARIEETLRKEFKEFAKDLSDKQSKGRVDIRYRSNAGQHIIVELKRADRVLTAGELIDQGKKYHAALSKCLQRQLGNGAVPSISVVFILGRSVAEDTQYVSDVLRAINGRIIYYDELIRGAQSAYSEFLKSQAKVDSIEKLLRGL